LTVTNENRKIGINVSVPFKHIETIDEKVTELGYKKRSNYIWALIKKDLDLDERE